MSKKVSGWPLIVPKEVDTSITGDQVMEALAADVESGDNRKVLTAIYGGIEGEETGSVEWARADHLPVIGEGDAGKVLTVNAGETGTEWAVPSGGGNQCSVGSILSTALNVMVGSLVQQSIQSSATKYQHVALSAPLNDYLPDAMSIRQAVKKCVTDGVAATLSIFGQSVVLQTYGIGESNSTPEYTVCGTVPAYGMTVPQVGYYQFRIIVTIGFVIDDSDNISSGFYEVTVEPVVTPSTT